MKNILLIAILILVFIFAISQLVLKSYSKNSVNAEYTVLKKYSEFEIREYPEMFVAKTKLSGSSYENNSSKGFRRIAGFIFGGNNKQQQISMTSPVIMDMKESVEMSFIMPDGITPANVPDPNNADVVLELRPKQIVAVLFFDGWASSEKLKKKHQELADLLTKNSIEHEKEFTYLGYDSPMQLVGRRNELLIPVQYHL